MHAGLVKHRCLISSLITAVFIRDTPPFHLKGDKVVESVRVHAGDLGLCKLGGIADPDPAPVFFFFITTEIKAVSFAQL